jgi:hypothetical protein
MKLPGGRIIQFVWWGLSPTLWFKRWQYPENWKEPLFYGFCFGVFEIRYFPPLRPFKGRIKDKNE